MPLPGMVLVRATPDRTAAALAGDLQAWAAEAVRERGAFHVALSGGSTPEPLYRRMASEAAHRNFPWARTHVWLVDERRVPEDDPASNLRMLRAVLLDHVPLPPAQLHPMRATAATAAADYEAELRRGLAAEGRLDAAVLGMGSDGHTASLFPRSPALAPGPEWVRANAGPTVTLPERLTLTAPFLSAARVVAVLVTGAAKRDMLGRVAGGAVTAQDAPVCAIVPADGTLRWFLDEAAAPPQ